MSEKEYLGETEFPVEHTPFAEYEPKDWALHFISRYSYVDGDRAKTWLLDQVARILFDTPIIVKQAAWTNGETEWRVSTAEPTPEYVDWAAEDEEEEW